MKVWLDRGGASVVVCCDECGPVAREVVPPAEGWSAAARHVQRVHPTDKDAKRHAEKNRNRQKRRGG